MEVEKVERWTAALARKDKENAVVFTPVLKIFRQTRIRIFVDRGPRCARRIRDNLIQVNRLREAVS